MAEGQTELQDLPGDLISKILAGVPPKDLALCRCVSRAWCDLFTGHQVLLDHHRYRPLQPLITLRQVVIGEDDQPELDRRCFVAADLSAGARRTLLRFDESVRGETRDTVTISFFVQGHCVHASCDGLLLLSVRHALFVCNPTTRRGAFLPPLHNTHSIVGFYPHAASGAYRVLCYRLDGDREEWRYYALTAGSPEAQPTSIAPPPATGPLGLECAALKPPVLLRNRLHWPPQPRQESILVFDTEDDSFRRIPPPPAPAIADCGKLFELSGKLAVFCFSKDAGTAELWLLKDLEGQDWHYQRRIDLPAAIPARLSLYCDHVFVYQEGDLLVDRGDTSDPVWHFDKEGSFKGSFNCACDGESRCDALSWDVTPHALRESLVHHEFFLAEPIGGPTFYQALCSLLNISP